MKTRDGQREPRYIIQRWQCTRMPYSDNCAHRKPGNVASARVQTAALIAKYANMYLRGNHAYPSEKVATSARLCDSSRILYSFFFAIP